MLYAEQGVRQVPGILSTAVCELPMYQDYATPKANQHRKDGLMGDDKRPKPTSADIVPAEKWRRH